jgi:hypothetical protein
VPAPVPDVNPTKAEFWPRIDAMSIGNALMMFVAGRCNVPFTPPSTSATLSALPL